MATFRINDGVVIDYTNDGWAEFKKWLNGEFSLLRYTWVDEGEAYNIIAFDAQVYRTCSINKSDAQEFEEVYRKDAPVGHFESDGTPILSLRQKQADGVPIFAESPRDGSEWVIGSHNFCDPCTWFGDSVRVDNETLTDSGDGLTFNSDNVNWIDMSSGRMHNDDIWVEIQKMMNPNDPHGYAVVVKVDGVEVDRCPDFSETGGDYWVDYDAGNVVFLSSQSGKTVTASYSYATSNIFRVVPMPGKILVIEDAECDISIDTHMNQAIIYSAWHFDGQQYVMDMAAQYKRSVQINVEARGCYPIFIAIGASEEELQISDLKEFRRKSRGMKYARQGAPFQYATAKKLRSSWGQEVRVFTSGTEPLPGEHVSVTFYCLDKDE
jgi:hypothetical protein